MSTKICVAPTKPKWKDAVTLGQLSTMMDALYGMGYDVDTPVTYLYDHRHVWLETVHDVDDDVDIVVEREPRVWASADDIPEGVIVSDVAGHLWKWADGSRYLKTRIDDEWGCGEGNDNEWVNEYAPFTEALS